MHEGLPNSLIEAMAVGTLLWQQQWVAFPSWLNMARPAFWLLLAMEKAWRTTFAVRWPMNMSLEMGIRGRDFILSSFDISRMVDDVQKLYDDVATDLKEE